MFNCMVCVCYIMVHSSFSLHCVDITEALLYFIYNLFSPSPFQCRAHRLSPGDDEMYQRTSVSIMKKEPRTGVMIHSCSPKGFTIDDNKVFGPCAVLPPAILQWNVSSGVLPMPFSCLTHALSVQLTDPLRIILL